MKITAVFTGQNGSCGYKHGQRYVLNLQNTGSQTDIEREDGSGFCNYESTISFLNNWNHIEIGNTPKPNTDKMREDKWIKVKDKMPENGGAYIVHGIGGLITIGSYNKSFKVFEFYDDEGSAIQFAPDAITHWKVLPTPPNK